MINVNIKDVSVSLENLPTPNNCYTVLIIKFGGKFGIGSKGKEDSDFMEEIIKLTINSWETYGLILDFSHLEYQWGNSISDVFWTAKLEKGAEFPVVILVSNLCKGALEGIRPLYQSNSDEKWLFDTLDDAILEIQKQINIRSYAEV